jgi:coenzyme F420-reducing hydrogenase delta subunit
MRSSDEAQMLRVSSDAPGPQTLSVSEAAEPSSWEPRIFAFLCNWCSYVGADLAGTSRLVYPATVRIIRLPCTGRVDPVFILRSFQRGADGVLVSGCHPGDCHYSKGNFYARRRMRMFRRLLEFVGIDPRRMQMSWVSASEGQKWAQVVTDVTNEITALGPLRA